MALTYLGTITKPHGIHGECFVTDVDIIPTLTAGTKVHLGFSAAYGTQAVLESIQPYRNGALLRLRGVNTVEQVEALREQGVFVQESLIADHDKELLSTSLTGAQVIVDATGRLLGTVREVWSAPAQRMLVVDHADGYEIMIPVVPSIVLKVTSNPHCVYVNPPDGLLDMNAPGNNSGNTSGNSDE
ncbi:MAG: rRNA processing protein RimM [Bacteroidota bacterium]|jgi:16S rRNA processing protein RimM